jgi:hypothetical protein
VTGWPEALQCRSEFNYNYDTGGGILKELADKAETI